MFDFSNPLTEIQVSVYKSRILNSFLCEVQVGFVLLYINWSPGGTLPSAPCRASLFGGVGRESKQHNMKLVINVSWEPEPSNNKNNNNNSNSNGPKQLSCKKQEQMET